jgi:hypothetical protein
MRRLAVLSVSLLALAAPAAAWSMTQAPGDGTLVIKNGAAPKGVPVVTLIITGAAIGRISNYGTIVIDDSTPLDPYSPEVSGFDWHKDVSPTATKWVGGGLGTGMKFRAVGGTYKITIYGSGVDLSAVGSGFVTLSGIPDTTTGDGVYSLNGDTFRSLPATPLVKLTLGTAPTG